MPNTQMKYLFVTELQNTPTAIYIEKFHRTSLSKLFFPLKIGEMYTVDVVASCGFGVEGKSFTNIESPFRKLIGDIISPTASNMIKFFVTLFMPKIAPILGIPFLSKDHDAWVRSFVDEVIKRRIQTGEKRQDFLQAFMELQKKKENGWQP